MSSTDLVTAAPSLLAGFHLSIPPLQDTKFLPQPQFKWNELHFLKESFSKNVSSD